MRKCIFYLMLLLSLQLMQAQTSATDEVKRLISRAKTAYSMGEYQDALVEYQKAQKLVPNFPDLYKAIGDVYEKLGGENDLKMAIENYEQYLKLSPNAPDKDAIQEKIASLEYKFEKQLKQTQILDDLSGLWVSDWTADNTKSLKEMLKSMSAEELELMQYIDMPYVMLEIKEIQKTGKYRVTLHQHSRIYKESIIAKTVNIVPTKNNSFQFVYADSKVYNPSAAKYNGLRAAINAAGGSGLAQGLGNVAIDFAQENDLPSNTQTAYEFDLKYKDGKLEGLLNIIGKHAVQSVAGTAQTNQDQLYEISFTKNNEYFDFVDNPLMEVSQGVLYLKNNMGHRRGINGYNKKELLNNPKFKNVKSAYNLQNTGVMITGLGIGGGLGIQFGRLFASIMTYETAEDKRKAKKLANDIGNYGAIISAGVAAIGAPIWISGNKKLKTSVEEYNNTIHRKNNQSYNLDFGITPSGNVGLVLNF